MKLLAVGDSFTYGDELDDVQSAWPYVLSKKLGYEVTNCGKPATGNTRIVRTVVEQIDNFNMFIVAWSHWGRIEFADDDGVYDIWPGCNTLQYQQFTPYRKELISYITKHYSDDYLYQQYLINIILLQNLAKQHDKKILMVNAFGGNATKFNSKFQNLTNQIDAKYFLGWPYITMMEWTYGVKQGPKGHFLEDGHNIVADKINEYIRNLGWLS